MRKQISTMLIALTLKGCADEYFYSSHKPKPLVIAVFRLSGSTTTIDVDVEHHLELLRPQASGNCKAHRRIALQRRQRFKVREYGASLPF